MSDQVAFLNYLGSILCCSLPGQCTALLPWDVTEAPASATPKCCPRGQRLSPACRLCSAHHEPVRDRCGGRSPPSPSPSWLTATGTITDYFPIALSTHRNAELDTHSGFPPPRSHARPCNLQRNLRSPSQRSCPGARTGCVQCGPRAGGQPEPEWGRDTGGTCSHGHGAAISSKEEAGEGMTLPTPEGKGKVTAKSC